MPHATRARRFVRGTTALTLAALCAAPLFAGSAAAEGIVGLITKTDTYLLKHTPRSAPQPGKPVNHSGATGRWQCLHGLTEERFELCPVTPFECHGIAQVTHIIGVSAVFAVFIWFQQHIRHRCTGSPQFAGNRLGCR